MVKIENDILEIVNKPGRVGVLATSDEAGQPNAAYFGSPRLSPEGTLIMGLMENQTLANLEQNPLAVFFVVQQAPVDFQTPGFRLYLKAREVQRQGPVLDGVREAVAAKAGADAAQAMKAGVVFEVTRVRPLVD
ncbi:MAG: pyridoxamine 5'-phosphate oxidase family protein [Desulfarculaceae bacterium]|nr:pyridoxamine 5'-phosphate oxidase family protein [Desulfarculaceae bacterium]MCF8102123.1 pyridoxamine 5'-phosphate oxidase family protein [Desulfarculaceae bacterium]MCF8118332.1 pyridoxamine 5'-phosphate oxidase family protein [Desulfarculaceae bacterium]